MVQQIGSFMAGGYVAGRMRSRWGETNRDEMVARLGLGCCHRRSTVSVHGGYYGQDRADVASKAAATAAANADPVGLRGRHVGQVRRRADRGRAAGHRNRHGNPRCAG